MRPVYAPNDVTQALGEGRLRCIEVAYFSSAVFHSHQVLIYAALFRQVQAQVRDGFALSSCERAGGWEAVVVRHRRGERRRRGARRRRLRCSSKLGGLVAGIGCLTTNGTLSEVFCPRLALGTKLL